MVKLLIGDLVTVHVNWDITYYEIRPACSGTFIIAKILAIHGDWYTLDTPVPNSNNETSKVVHRDRIIGRC